MTQRTLMLEKSRNRTIRRRDLLAGTAAVLLGVPGARATTLGGQLPWTPNAGNPPAAAKPGPWLFFTGAEGRAIEALADRIIPPDSDTPGGKDSGCAVFIDRQLAGPYGRQEGLYLRPPFQAGAKNQGPQSQEGPTQNYRVGLAALDQASKERFGGKSFSEVSDADKDQFLDQVESGAVKLDGIDGQSFFAQVIKDVQMGFFADPIYGGNRNMAAWKMIGYPGARYNYLDWVNRHNERFPLPPVSLTGRADWTTKS
jgi:gluconate 2-dehydrogenase gamma chain